MSQPGGPALGHSHDDFAMWLRGLAGPAAFERALKAARASGSAVHETLLRRGVIGEEAYASALARRIGAPRLHWGPHVTPLALVPHETLREVRVQCGRDEIRLLDAGHGAPDAVAARVAELRAQGVQAALASARVYEHAVEVLVGRARLDWAVTGLRLADPLRSAAGGTRRWQYLAPVLAVGVLLGGIAVLPDVTLALATGLMGLPFLCVTVLRALALQELARGRRGARRVRIRKTERGAALPFYSVLVPLFRETRVLRDLVAALAALDYPPERHEVLLLIEAVDLDMQAALLDCPLPNHFRILLIPDREPRTKPKALNYALQFAQGSLVVIYDAEDRPQAGQLRQAVELFRTAPTTLGCAQARLNIYNPTQSWITRQFTIEYSALFDAILPMLERLALPVPLGGTSNHFRRDTLERVMAWDPYNVTEDADLGIRLARLGYSTAVLDSTTWEEAPTTFTVWLRQRTRWIKGWMQTWLVHTRDLGALNRELGAAGVLGFHAVLGGLVLSALALPLFFALVLYQGHAGVLLAPAESGLEAAMLWVAWGNLVAGYLISMLVGIASVWRRGRKALALHALMMPIYWVMISVAAYRALWQLLRAPYLWEKTPHGAARPRSRGTSKRTRR